MTQQTPAGWYPDPYGSPQLRWWDGNQWTDATHPLEQGAQQPSSGPQQPRSQQPDWSSAPANPTLAYGQQPQFAQAQPQVQPQAQGQPIPPGQPTQPGQAQAPGQWGGTPLPGPGYGPPPKKGSPLPWVLGGLAALVVVALIAVAGIYLANSSSPVAAPTDTPSQTQEGTEEPAPSDPPTDQPTDQPTEQAKPPAELPQPQDGTVTDTTTGISYAVPDGWTVPKSSTINGTNPAFQTWTSGVNKVSHEKYNGKDDWIGNIYAGELIERYPYTGVAGLGTTAKLVLADFARYYDLPNESKIAADKAIKIGDRDAWVLQFEFDFSKVSADKGYKWKKESGAVVLMDRGENERPTLLYISVPDNLGTDVVSDVLSSIKPA